MHDRAFEGLPGPQSDRVVVYVFGSRPGESQVVSLPDGRWVVIDGCGSGERNYPLRLLEHHDVSVVDLLVLTHPDRDHYAGVAEILEQRKVRLAWRYPGMADQRTILARLCSSDAANPKWVRLHGDDGVRA